MKKYHYMRSDPEAPGLPSGIIRDISKKTKLDHNQVSGYFCGHANAPWNRASLLSAAILELYGIEISTDLFLSARKTYHQLRASLSHIPPQTNHLDHSIAGRGNAMQPNYLWSPRHWDCRHYDVCLWSSDSNDWECKECRKYESDPNAAQSFRDVYVANLCAEIAGIPEHEFAKLIEAD